MFSQTLEYALRATVCLAQNAERLMTTAEIAELTLVPQGYLSKVLQLLTRAELIEATRGINGGYALAREAEKITILEVVNAVDPLKRIRTCPLKLKTHGKSLCPLHRKLDNAIAEVERAFATTTLDDLLKDPSATTPLCEAGRI
jgi:Rrf2 family transcriptional regulator, nitric oxide-sensitive transcriptional repressor